MMRLLLILAFLPLAGRAASDWLQFRGPGSSGNAGEGSNPPRTFEGADGVAWKAALPGRGLSSPLVSGGRVYVTAASGPKQERLHVLCFGDGDGKLMWEREFRATGRTMCHAKTCNAAPTPCSDGKHVYALFSSNDLICLDMEGNLVWLRGLMVDYPNAGNSLGLASSPVMAGGVVVAQIENDSDSFTAGIDAGTGVELWHRPGAKDANWTSPAVQREADGTETVIVASRDGAVAVDPKSGRERWKLEGPGSSVPSITVSGSFMAQPRSGKGHAVWRLKGGTTPPERVWESAQVSADTASPVMHGGRLFAVSGAGVLTCANLEDGERPWKLRLDGKFSGSPVMAGSMLYIGSELGVLIGVDTASAEGEEGKVTGRLELGAPILCTPSLSGRSVYVRSDGNLWKVGGR
jgi:hypothetical protein